MCGIAQFGTSDSLTQVVYLKCDLKWDLWLSDCAPIRAPSCRHLGSHVAKPEHGVQWNLDVLYWLWPKILAQERGFRRNTNTNAKYSILRSACKKWHSHPHLWIVAVSTLSTATLFQWYQSTCAPTILTQTWPLDLYINDIVLQVLPQFILLQLFLLEVLHLYFNVLYLQVLPQFLLCPFSACTVVRFNYCFLLNLNCEKCGRIFVKCTGWKCLRRILFEVSHNFHLLVEKFAIVPPTEIVFDQLWEFGPTGLWLWSCVVCCLWCVVFVLLAGSN